jgi:hypothetical protein
MAECMTFLDQGYSDANRDTTSGVEHALRERLKSEQIVCTYDGFGRMLAVYLGDELDPTKRQLSLSVSYQLNVALDIEEISNAVIEAAGALAKRSPQPSALPKDSPGA